MTSKAFAVTLGLLLILTNAGWVWWMIDTAVTLDHSEQQVAADSNDSQVLIELATRPLAARTPNAALLEIHQRIPGALAKAHGDTVEVSALQLIFGRDGLKQILHM